MTADLAAWLLADDGPIAEDERVARAFHRTKPWWVQPNDDDGPVWDVMDRGDPTASSSDDWVARVWQGPDADHIARWDPARVLAECAAKRRVASDYLAATEAQPLLEPGVAVVTMIARETLEVVLSYLAQPYAGRPGWREEWRA